mgnify:CR=1 FL=1
MPQTHVTIFIQIATKGADEANQHPPIKRTKTPLYFTYTFISVQNALSDGPMINKAAT